MGKRATVSFTQIPLEDMERGLAQPVATWKWEPQKIEDWLSLRFETAKDDLDTLKVAVLADMNGCQFALVRHDHQPAPGTDILVNERSRNFGVALKAVLKALCIQPDDLQWLHPDVDPLPLIP